jgi:hypothetical protein
MEARLIDNIGKWSLGCRSKGRQGGLCLDEKNVLKYVNF